MPLVSSEITRTSSAAGAGMPASAMTRDQCSNPGVTCGVVGVVWCGAVWCGACGGAEQFGAEQCGGRGVVGACGGAERVVVRSGVVGAVWWCGVVVRVRYGTVLLYSSAMKYVSSRSRPMASESGRSERDGSTTTIIMPCGERTSDRVDLSSAQGRSVRASTELLEHREGKSTPSQFCTGCPRVPVDGDDELGS